MTIWLHIGTPKTGTTALQTFLANNRSILRQLGFLYPKSPGLTNHSDIGAYPLDQDFTQLPDLLKRKALTSDEAHRKFRRRFEQTFHNEILDFNDNVILSNEILYAFCDTPHRLKRLRTFLDQTGHSTKIIVYLRRQDDAFLSNLSTKMLKGHPHKLQLPFRPPHNGQYNYGPKLYLWAQEFGDSNLIVRRYGSRYFDGEDIIDDFRSALGIPYHEAFTKPQIVNSRLDAVHMEWLYRLNQKFSEQTGGSFEKPYPREIATLLKQLSTENKLPISNAERRQFLFHFNEENNEIARHWLSEEQLFHTDDIKSDHYPTKHSDELTLDRAFEIFAEVWRAEIQSRR